VGEYTVATGVDLLKTLGGQTKILGAEGGKKWLPPKSTPMAVAYL